MGSTRRILTIDLTEEQFKLFQDTFPWGLRQSFFRPIVEDICEIIQSEKKDMFVSGIISRSIRLWNFEKAAFRSKED